VTVTSKRLVGPASLTTSAETKYIVPFGAMTVIERGRVSNPSGGMLTFTLSIGTDAPGTRLYDAVPVPANGSLDIQGPFTLSQSDIVQGFGSGTALVLELNGTVSTLGGPFNFVDVGNSLTWGDINTGQSPTPWPSVQATDFPTSTSHNLGVQGKTTPQLTADFASTALPLLSGSLRNVLFLWEGINDIRFGGGGGGQTPAQAWQHYKDYCDNARALGWTGEIYVANCIFADPATDGALWALLQTFNGLLDADHSFADGSVVDLAGISIFQSYNATYYQTDRVHLTDAGYAAIETLGFGPFAGAL
jgi:lysophospholipase L1-like esterase